VASPLAVPSGTTFYLKSVISSRAGAIADWNLGVGCGSVIPDRSGRYHGTINPPTGGTWSHLISTCPMEAPSGPERSLATFDATPRRSRPGQRHEDDHAFARDDEPYCRRLERRGASVAVAVNRKAGDVTNAVELGFSLVGAPTVAVNFLVIIG
jgi:hypothetical protein